MDARDEQLTGVAAGFRDALAQFPVGVAVVTARSPNGAPAGLTVASLASYSVDPPTVVINVARGTRSRAAIVASQRFAVHLLADDQERLARRFATAGIDKFAGLPWTAGNDGTPRIAGCLAVLACRVVRVVDHGDHTLVLGEVDALDLAGGRPLVYHDRRYRTLG